MLKKTPSGAIASAVLAGLLAGCSVGKVNRSYRCVKTNDGKTIVEIVDRKKCKGKGK